MSLCTPRFRRTGSVHTRPRLYEMINNVMSCVWVHDGEIMCESVKGTSAKQWETYETMPYLDM